MAATSKGINRKLFESLHLFCGRVNQAIKASIGGCGHDMNCFRCLAAAGNLGNLGDRQLELCLGNEGNGGRMAN